MRIKAKELTGTVHEVDVESNESILLLKYRLEEIANKPVDQMRLIYAGKQLEDSRTLSDYNIQEGS